MRVLWVSALALLATGAPLQAQDRSVTLAVRGDVRVRVGNPTGPTIISAWERNEVWVETNGSLRDVNVRTGERRVDITATNDQALTIRVPRGTQLEASSGSGPISIRGIENTIDVEAGSGPINIDATARSITAIGFSGGVTIRGGGTEITRAESASGSVSVSQARGVVDLNSTSGSVMATGAIRDGKLFSVSGSVSFDGTVERGGRLSLESTSGSVVLRIPAGTPAEYDLSSANGHIQNAFGPRVQSGGIGSNLRFAVGGGGARIKASTVSGSVVIRER